MIIKSKPRANGGKLADYLLKEQKNERAELLEMRGFSVDNLKAALNLEEELAETKTRCEKPFYHVSFRAAPGEELTPEQWQHCADKLEKRLGLENNHRAIVLQTHEGEQHMHVVWSRIDPETLKAVNLYRDHYHCKEVAREIERELGLQKVRNHKREEERELAAPSFGEDQEARRKGQDLKETRAAIREAWEQSADGRSFAAALKERGLELAKGERRDFVAVDERGSVHSIGKRTTGASAAEVREKLADLDRERMPTVERVREEQKRELAKEHEADRERAKTERFLKRQDEIKAELLKRQEAEREQLKKRMEERGQKLADWGRDKGQQITAELRDRQKADRATLETRMDEKKLNWIDKARLRLELEKTQEREREDAERRKEKLELAITRTERRRIEENTRRARDQQERHADQRAKLEIRQAEIREQYGIKAPDRDEAAREAKRERERLGFARAARESGGDVTRTAPQRQPKPEREQKPRSTADRLDDAVTKGLGGLVDFFVGGSPEPKRQPEPQRQPEPEREQKPRSAADRLDDAATTVLGGLADFFVGGTPAPKQQKTRSQEMKEEMERLKAGRKDPRYKTIAEWQAEARYNRQVEIERRASLTPEQRREEDRQREEERARERERDRERERGGRERERER